MEALGLNYADWFILVILIASGIISFSRGFTTEFLSLFLWFAAFIAAITLEHLATPQINEFVQNKDVSKIISYIVVFTLFIFLGRLLIKFISKIVIWSSASGFLDPYFDRFFGFLFGLSRGFIFLFAIFLLLPSNLKTTDLINNSKITPVIEKYAPRIEAYFRDLIDNKDVVEEVVEIIEPLKEDSAPESDNENTQDEGS